MYVLICLCFRRPGHFIALCVKVSRIKCHKVSGAYSAPQTNLFKRIEQGVHKYSFDACTYIYIYIYIKLCICVGV